MATLRILNRLFAKQNLRAFQRNISIVKRGCSFLSFNSSTSLALRNNTGLFSLSFSRVCGCGMHNISEGDQQLLAFLKEELNYENEAMKNLEKPKLELFNQSDDIEDMRFKMTRLSNGERIAVSFDVDQSINHEELDDEDEGAGGKLTSYPSFSIQIIKDSGETLHFNCEYNFDDAEDSPEEDNELFTITDISLLPHPDADHNSVYHCETENMDYNLYELLLGMLTERGINNEFLTDLLKKSTILEHQHYVKFLEGLQGFLTQK